MISWLICFPSKAAVGEYFGSIGNGQTLAAGTQEHNGAMLLLIGVRSMQTGIFYYLGELE